VHAVARAGEFRDGRVIRLRLYETSRDIDDKNGGRFHLN
jgi:hypothetical protein